MKKKQSRHIDRVDTYLADKSRRLWVSLLPLFILTIVVYGVSQGVNTLSDQLTQISRSITEPNNPNVVSKTVLGANNFTADFTGDPSAPLSYTSGDWMKSFDVTVHSRDASTWNSLEAVQAQHGPGCESPNDPGGNHTVTAYEDAVFQCKNHMMTALHAGGYGVIYVTPDHMVDFSSGEAVISFDMSTFRSSQRDWIDVWISPYDQHNQLTLLNWLPDLNGPARNAVHVEQMDIHNNFTAGIIRNYQDDRMRGSDYWVGYEEWLTPDRARRDTFEIRLSRNHIKVSMPQYNRVFLDREISPALDWDTGVVQFGHHSYNPGKGCFGQPDGTCAGNTWHWDNMSISPSIPFTIINTDRRAARNANGSEVFNLEEPAPEGSHARFVAFAGNNPEISWDGGQSWHAAELQQTESNDGNRFWPYWTPIPAGTTALRVRGTEPWNGGYNVRDLSVWSRSVDGSAPPPTTPPAVTNTPAPTVPAPTSTPRPQPSPTNVPGPTTPPVVTNTPAPTTPPPTPVPTPGPNPEPGAYHQIPGTIQAEAYGTMDDRPSYYDKTRGNSGASKSPECDRQDDVDIQATSDSGGGCNIGWIDAGEWLSYPVNISQTGTYTVDFRVATARRWGRRTFHLEVDGVDVSGPIRFRYTGGWQSWETVSVPGIELKAGTANAYVVFDSDRMNLNHMTFTKTN